MTYDGLCLLPQFVWESLQDSNLSEAFYFCLKGVKRRLVLIDTTEVGTSVSVAVENGQGWLMDRTDIEKCLGWKSDLWLRSKGLKICPALCFTTAQLVCCLIIFGAVRVNKGRLNCGAVGQTTSTSRRKTSTSESWGEFQRLGFHCISLFLMQ